MYVCVCADTPTNLASACVYSWPCSLFLSIILATSCNGLSPFHPVQRSVKERICCSSEANRLDFKIFFLNYASTIKSG